MTIVKMPRVVVSHEAEVGFLNDAIFMKIDKQCKYVTSKVYA